MDDIYLTAEDTKQFSETLSYLENEHFSQRLLSKDATLWKSEPEHTKIISNSLGWTHVYRDMYNERLGEIQAFTEEARKKFKYAVVLGMGGSSLAPEVLSRLFETKKGYLKLIVLDSTNPDWIKRLSKEFKLKETLFIFASKSGTTVEPNSFYKYFWGEVSKINKNPGSQFIAITDKGTYLEKLSYDNAFLKTFINPSDIGGRFSALSLFGLIPAALMGINVKLFLERAIEMGDRCGANVPLNDNPAALLGAFMARSQAADKVTVLMPQKLFPFGLWIEQLVAESTGKEGKGIVPIAGEIAPKNYNYSPDRTFVTISLKGEKDNPEAQILKEEGKSVAEYTLNDAYDLSAQFLLWEIATAAAGKALGIDPFDQPNVQESKTLTNELLSGLKPGGKVEIKTVKVKASKALENEKITAANWLKKVLNSVNHGDYVGVLAYIDGPAATDKVLSSIRTNLLRLTGCATLSSYGPRYLHSTGQLHKGGQNNGVFIIVASQPKNSLPIEGQTYTFAQLCNAQAEGDFRALDNKGRRVIKVELPSPDYLKKIDNDLKEILGGKMEKTKTTVKKTTKTAAAKTTAAKATPKKAAVVKKVVKTTAKAKPETKENEYKVIAPKAYVIIDHPASGEEVSAGHYAIRIGAGECCSTEVKINGGEWQPCRYSIGYWWHDTHFNKDNNTVQARTLDHMGNEILVTKPRKFKAK